MTTLICTLFGPIYKKKLTFYIHWVINVSCLKYRPNTSFMQWRKKWNVSSKYDRREEFLILKNLFNSHYHHYVLKDWLRKLLGMCIGCIIAKTNIHGCVVGYNVPTCFRHFCKMLDMMFQHPDTV